MTDPPKAAPLVPEEDIAAAILDAPHGVDSSYVGEIKPWLRDFGIRLLTEECETCGGTKWRYCSEVHDTIECDAPLCGQHGAPKGRVRASMVQSGKLFNEVAVGYRRGAAAERERIIKWLRGRSTNSLGMGALLVDEPSCNALANELESRGAGQ